jgi:putative DNA primase/helicase
VPLPSNDKVLDFDAATVAAQIRGHQPILQFPAQTVSGVSAAGLLPHTLCDRGNAKLFVHLYANDYRRVPGIG